MGLGAERTECPGSALAAVGVRVGALGWRRWEEGGTGREALDFGAVGPEKALEGFRGGEDSGGGTSYRTGPDSSETPVACKTKAGLESFPVMSLKKRDGRRQCMALNGISGLEKLLQSVSSGPLTKLEYGL